MTDFIINFVRHPFFGIVTGLAGFLLGHRLSLGRERISRFNEAAQKFRDAFREESYYFSPEPKGYVYFSNIIILAEVKHRTAYDEFFIHLSRFQQPGFSKAWQCYRERINAYKEDASIDEKREAVSIIYKSMQTLLSYAKPK